MLFKGMIGVYFENHMLRYVMLCYAYVMLCYVMLCYVMLCYATLCYVTLRYVMLCYVMLCCVMLCYVMLCYVMLGVLTLNSFLSVIFACFYVYEFHGQVGSSPASYSVGPEFRSPQDSSCLD